MTEESVPNVITAAPPWRAFVRLPDEVSNTDDPGLADYQKVAVNTDKLPSGLELPILGLFGEVGGLLSAFKKKQRDQDSFDRYRDALLEEFGDVLWYFTTLASRANLKLPVLAQRMFRGITDWDEVDEHFGSFGDIQHQQERPASSEEFSKCATALAGAVGDLLNDFRQGGFASNRDKLSAHLVEIFAAIVAAADAADISLGEAARENLYKIFNRWPMDFNYPPLTDSHLKVFEKLPEKLDIYISEEEIDGRLFVLQRCNDIYIGDRLTDNKEERDDYRFHDVFHLAFAVHLGWSPVLRALLHLKRKSDPNIDENQDGARAILIEEGVATFIFGRGMKAGWDQKDITNVDYDLLKYIAEFVRGYEPERCCMWQWERAIVNAFKVFGELKKHRKGRVVANLREHTLTFFPVQP